MYYVLLALATWRISSLLVNEDGPWHVFARLRALVGVRHDDEFQPVASNVVAGAFTCIWCMSVWVALALSVLSWFWSGVAAWIVLPLALSAGAIMIAKAT
jgi:fatty acid desaturase